ncbi:TetR/AcrR family transcriptional regulator [uncultured Roseovarius sp.]|uniref:TetR/AcrR family transcriptional regulator n=1 Tax=uncultured Roseovarius sp. TaxID=293344 RepID=UPI00261AD1A6|nr:TetR/AcrR family transcriptional regulator [uncultured Roseovarius sp.]
MTLHSRRPQPDRQIRLTGDDWIQTALEMLISDGIEAIQITVLARKMNVTRGSFYWHFDSREALLDALLKEWRSRNTGVMVEAIADTETLDDGILALFSVWTDHTRFDPQLDQAIRDWARHDDDLRASLQAEDDARVAAISDFFQRHHYDPTEAFIRARIIYFTQLSYYALNVQEPMADRLSYLSAYFLSFTGREINADIAARQIEKFLEKDMPK